MSLKRIVIIEDQRDLSLALQKALVAEGYEVTVSFEGESGYQQVESVKPDLVLLDLLLPKVFGLDLLARIRQHADKHVANVPVIVITNYPQQEYQARAKELGALAFLVKSDYDLIDVVKRVKSALGE